MTDFDACFLILTVAILGASCGNKDVDKFAVKNSIPVALYWNKGKVPYEISQQFGTNMRKKFQFLNNN